MTSRSERKQQRALARHGKVRPQSKPRAFFAFLAKTVAVVAISALTVTGVSAWELSQSIQGRSIQLIGADGKAFTFKLRKGVKFQDGAAFDSAAVKFSFDRAKAEKSTNKAKAQATWPGDTLAKAESGQMDEAELYRFHTQLVDRLADLKTALAGFEEEVSYSIELAQARIEAES